MKSSEGSPRASPEDFFFVSAIYSLLNFRYLSSLLHPTLKKLKRNSPAFFSPFLAPHS